MRIFGRPSWLDEGKDPDYRYSLANERTFLAWIRTSLSLIAGSVAVVQLVPPFRVENARTALGLLLAAAGVATAILAYQRWSANERAMRSESALPYTWMLAVMSSAIALVGVVVLLLALTERR